MQIAGTGLRMDYRTFEHLFEEESAIRRPLLAYAQCQSVLLGQIAGCNRLHAVETRLARWLVMVQDRTGENVLKLTQEFLGQMMGTQRTGLENAACECYPITRMLLKSLYKVANEFIFDEE